MKIFSISYWILIKINIIVLVLFFFKINPSKAAYVPLQFENQVYENTIKSVLLTQNNSLQRTPIAALGAKNVLKLVFDELKSTNDFYNYTYIHCDANWNQSNMLNSEYLLGNTVGNIDNYSFSTSTYVRYTQYQIVFPSDAMMPKFSGNYLLVVYRNFDINDIILSRRFMIIDDKTIVTPSIKSSSTPEKRFTSHEINFTVDYKNYNIPNPYTDVNFVIQQNNRWDNALFNVKPTFVSNNLLTYNTTKTNNFDGGNEFRFFDIRSLRGPSLNVRRKYYDSTNNIRRAILRNDGMRGSEPYLFWTDFNGKIVYDNADIANNDFANQDYVLTTFSLVTTDELYRKEVYLFGEITDWKIDEKFKLSWNSFINTYELDITLKQGYYDYYYITKDEENGESSIEKTEGNYFQTENDYCILVYHKNQLYKYDELIGYNYFSSKNLGR